MIGIITYPQCRPALQLLMDWAHHLGSHSKFGGCERSHAWHPSTEWKNNKKWRFLLICRALSNPQFRHHHQQCNVNCYKWDVLKFLHTYSPCRGLSKSSVDWRRWRTVWTRRWAMCDAGWWWMDSSSSPPHSNANHPVLLLRPRPRRDSVTCVPQRDNI